MVRWARWSMVRGMQMKSLLSLSTSLYIFLQAKCWFFSFFASSPETSFEAGVLSTGLFNPYCAPGHRGVYLHARVFALV